MPAKVSKTEDGKRKRRVRFIIACGISAFFFLFLAPVMRQAVYAADDDAAVSEDEGPAAAVSASGGSAAFEMEKVVPFEFNGDVRTLLRYPMVATPSPRPYRPLLSPPPTQKFQIPFAAPKTPAVSITPLAPAPAPLISFPGLSFTDTCTGGQCGGGWPPDTNGDVGPNHYIEAVNTAYAIYNKTGTLQASFTENQLWSGSGVNPCNGNSVGDPVVLYDQMADRWILTNFAFAFSGGVPVSPFYQCIAVSKTGDPVAGGWWLYPLRMDPGGVGLPPVGTLNDYAKFGMWPDCLYMSANEFTMPAETFAGTIAASFSRSDMYSGAPLTWSLVYINNTTGPFTMLPSNMLGTSATSFPRQAPLTTLSRSRRPSLPSRSENLRQARTAARAARWAHRLM